MKTVKSFVLILLGAGLALAMNSTAHTPCDDDYSQPRCRYVQTVNPYTGDIETQYVCN